MRSRSQIVCLLLPAVSVALRPGCANNDDGVRLVVVVVVDQMRADYLERFDGQLGAGLARLRSEGAVFDDARWTHALTLTAPGHASLATGTFPRRHGLVANSWVDRATGAQVYALGDPASPLLGQPAGAGRSPARLERTAVGDWLKEASPASRVYSVALKDRAAIPMGGHRADGVFWYEPTSGRFVTSAHYMEAYPGWVEAFNDSGRVADLLRDPWVPLLPEGSYDASREDEFPAEADGIHTTFPHALPDPMSLMTSPGGDRLLLSFARELIEHEELGGDDFPDLLWIGASAADEIGHVYGPYSREVQDYYLRLDRMLGELLEFLDRRVGGSRYVVALSSDHGVLPLPEELTRRGTPARRIDGRRLGGVLARAIRRAGGELGIPPPLPLGYASGIVLDPRSVPEGRAAELRRALARQLREAAFVEDAFTYDELLDEAAPDRPHLEAYRRSFHPERTADVVLRLGEHHVISDTPASRTGHGSPYPHDAHVPLILAGPGIVAGRHERRVDPVDLAPTLARLLGIEPPGDLDGHTLGDALE